MLCEDGEEDRGVDAVHEVEVEFDGLVGPLRGTGVVDGEVRHLGDCPWEGVRGYGVLRSMVNHLGWGSSEDSVADLISVRPVRGGEQVWITADLGEKGEERF